MITDVIILGGHIQALGLARQVHALGVKVHLCIPDRYAVAKYSNTVSTVFLYKDNHLLLQWMKGRVGREKTTLLFPTNDEMVEWLDEHRTELEKYFYVGIPGREVVNLFNDKTHTYQFAERKQIPAPKTWYPENLEHARLLAKEMAYPVIIKPSVMYTFHEQFGKKAFRCNTETELHEKMEEIANAGYEVKGLLIQEMLMGGPQYLYSFGTCAVEGEPIVSLTANRIRQNPMDFGNSTTFAVLCDVPEIEMVARKILKETRYTGLAEVEFMYDANTNQYKFLEINTRAWKWHTISNHLDFSFIGALIAYYNGQLDRYHIQQPITGKMAWVERLTDMAVSIKACMAGKLKWKEIYKTYASYKLEYAVWSWKDPMPAIMYILLSPLLYIKRY